MLGILLRTLQGIDVNTAAFSTTNSFTSAYRTGKGSDDNHSVEVLLLGALISILILNKLYKNWSGADTKHIFKKLSVNPFQIQPIPHQTCSPPTAAPISPPALSPEVTLAGFSPTLSRL